MKENPDDTIYYKARLVVKGFQQIAGVDCTETYAPLSKLHTVCLLLAICSCNQWPIIHMDVVMTFY